MEAYSLFFYFKHINIYKTKYTLTVEAGEPCSKARVLTKLGRTAKQTTKTTRTHEGLSGRNDQPLLPHKGLHKVEKPWKNQGLPWPLIAVTLNSLRRPRRKVSCTYKTVFQPAVSLLQRQRILKPEIMLCHYKKRIIFSYLSI